MYKVTKEGKGCIVARIVADSVSEYNNRITTFEVEYPRFIHSELMTHRHFSRNAMSSRAVPVSKMIEQVKNDPAMPIHWGKNKSGMQASEELQELVMVETTGIMGECSPQRAWSEFAEEAANAAQAMSDAGYHKQIVNRLLEPFQVMKTIVTATEYDNFFWLRLDPDAQPEIKELAEQMYEAMQESTPELLKAGEWHTPYVEHFRASDGDASLEYIVDNVGVDVEEAKAISASCCAQVSYRRLDNTYDKAMSVYDRLGVGGNKIHASPFEHVASPMLYPKHTRFPEMAMEYGSLEEGLTHCDTEGEGWSGNLKGWIQLRQLLPNHTCSKYKETK